MHRNWKVSISPRQPYRFNLKSRLQVKDVTDGVCASTIAEVDHFAKHGFRDVFPFSRNSSLTNSWSQITYAVPVAADKLKRLKDIAIAFDVTVCLFVDRVER
jgi:D-serine deaminase-like pyridoxal phosphate-dependent protein